MVVLGLALTGCAYRLARWTMPSQQRLKIVGISDDAYVIRFDLIRVQRGVDPLTAKRFEIVRGGKIVGKLSLKEIGELPTDSEGYHLLTFNS
jgi:hypothetical protein